MRLAATAGATTVVHMTTAAAATAVATVSPAPTVIAASSFLPTHRHASYNKPYSVMAWLEQTDVEEDHVDLDGECLRISPHTSGPRWGTPIFVSGKGTRVDTYSTRGALPSLPWNPRCVHTQRRS